MAVADVEVEFLIQRAIAAERERCAKIAEAHKGLAGKQRRERGFNRSGSSFPAEVLAEERGEDIAAEMIAAAIRKSE